MKTLTICFALLVLVAVRATAQDDICTTFVVDTVACNDPPHGGCSSHASVPNVIVDGTGNFGCMHPAPQQVMLNCPGGASCPPSSPYTVQASNPYCEQTYTACGCVGPDCIGTGGCCVSGCADPTHFACLPDCNCHLISPIIVDTTGKGFQLTSADAGVLFDMAGDGHPLKIAWTAANSTNAFLALDRNYNGKIDSGKELFGNFTAQPKSPHRNGYLALAEFDKPENGGNGDGIIDQRDAVYPRLLLWIDANHDGISQASELHTLPELGVSSISLNYKDDHHEDQYGNLFHYRAALNPDPLTETPKDGRWTYDVFFLHDTTAVGNTAVNCAAKKPTFAKGGLEEIISAVDHSLN